MYRKSNTPSNDENDAEDSKKENDADEDESISLGSSDTSLVDHNAPKIHTGITHSSSSESSSKSSSSSSSSSESTSSSSGDIGRNVFVKRRRYRKKPQTVVLRRKKRGSHLKQLWLYKHNKGYINFVSKVYLKTLAKIFLDVLQSDVLNSSNNNESDADDDEHDHESDREESYLDSKTNETNSLNNLSNKPDEADSCNSSDEKNEDDVKESTHTKIGISKAALNILVTFSYQKFSKLCHYADMTKRTRMNAASGKKLMVYDMHTVSNQHPEEFGFMDPVQTLERLSGPTRDFYLEILLCLMRNTENKKVNIKPNYDDDPANISSNGIFFKHFALAPLPAQLEFDQQFGKRRKELSKNLFLGHKESKKRKKEEESSSSSFSLEVPTTTTSTPNTTTEIVPTTSDVANTESLISTKKPPKKKSKTN